MIQTVHNKSQLVLSYDGGLDGDKQIIKRRTIPIDPLITGDTGNYTQEQLQKIVDVGFTLSSLIDSMLLSIAIVPTINLTDTEA
jgi:hypothetical protein